MTKLAQNEALKLLYKLESTDVNSYKIVLNSQAIPERDTGKMVTLGKALAGNNLFLDIRERAKGDWIVVIAEIQDQKRVVHELGNDHDQALKIVSHLKPFYRRW